MTVTASVPILLLSHGGDAARQLELNPLSELGLGLHLTPRLSLFPQSASPQEQKVIATFVTAF